MLQDRLLLFLLLDIGIHALVHATVDNSLTDFDGSKSRNVFRRSSLFLQKDNSIALLVHQNYVFFIYIHGKVSVMPWYDIMNQF